MKTRRSYGVLFDRIFWFMMMILPIFIYFTLNYHNPTATMDFFAFVETFSPFTWLSNILDEVTMTAWGETFALSKYLAYAFGVELCHVIYDVCAFIPRLAHKWIGRSVQND